MLERLPSRSDAVWHLLRRSSEQRHELRRLRHSLCDPAQFERDVLGGGVRIRLHRGLFRLRRQRRKRVRSHPRDGHHELRKLWHGLPCPRERRVDVHDGRLRRRLQHQLPPVRRRLREQLERDFVWRLLRAVSDIRQRDGDVQRHGVRLLMRGRFCRLQCLASRRLRGQPQRGYVPLWQLHESLHGAGERSRDLHVRRVRLHLQRRLPQLRRRVREQQQREQLRRLLCLVLGAAERHRHVQWRQLRIRVSGRLFGLQWTRGRRLRDRA